MSQLSNRDGRENGHMSDGEKEEDKRVGRMDFKGRSTERLERAEKELFETQLQLKAKVYGTYILLYKCIWYMYVLMVCTYMHIYIK